MTQTTPRLARTWWPRLRHRTSSKNRHLGLDAARGVAVLGMVLAHVAVVPDWGSSPEALLGFAYGHSSIIFATIAGVGLALMSGAERPLEGDELRSARLHILGRAIVLLIISGLIELLPPVVAVILASYALWFILALPALRWRPRTLFIVAACLAALGTTGSYLFLNGIIAMGGRVTATPESFFTSLLFSGTYPALVWMAFVLAGIGIGRCGLANVVALKRLVIVGSALFIAFAAPFVAQERSLSPLFSNAAADRSTPAVGDTYCLTPERTSLIACDREQWKTQTQSFTHADWALYENLLQEKQPSGDTDPMRDWSQGLDPAALWSIAPHSGTPFEAFSSGGFAIALICGLVLLGHLPWSRFALWALSGVGAMSLTAYVAHIIVIVATSGLKKTDNILALWLIVGLVVACTAWHWLFDSGPLERLTAAAADRLEGRQKPGQNSSSGSPKSPSGATVHAPAAAIELPPVAPE